MFSINTVEKGRNMYAMYIMSGDDDYDSGAEDSGKSQDWDMEPGDPGWLGAVEDDDDDD